MAGLAAKLTLEQYLEKLPMVPLDVLRHQLVSSVALFPTISPSFDELCYLEPGTLAYAMAESPKETEVLEVRGFLASGETYLISRTPWEVWSVHRALVKRFSLLASVEEVFGARVYLVLDRRDRRLWLAKREFVNRYRYGFVNQLDKLKTFYGQLLARA